MPEEDLLLPAEDQALLRVDTETVIVFMFPDDHRPVLELRRSLVELDRTDDPLVPGAEERTDERGLDDEVVQVDVRPLDVQYPA